MLQLEKKVEALEMTVRELQGEVERLLLDLSRQKHPVEALLRQRGLPILSQGERSSVLLPPDSSSAHEEKFYEHMRRYSFRLFLRELIQSPRGKDPSVLGRYCSSRTVRAYLKMLAQMRVVEIGESYSFRLIRDKIISFGPTLEWYVSKVLEREFMAPALFNVRLDNTRFGGDYDIIAILAGRLICIEVKSSPPRGVALSAVMAFLSRLMDLQPHMAVFVVDTELRMRDKIVPLFSEALAQLGEKQENWPVVRLSGEVFQICHGIYLINSRKGIYSNLRQCFRDFIRFEMRSRLPALGEGRLVEDGRSIDR